MPRADQLRQHQDRRWPRSSAAAGRELTRRVPPAEEPLPVRRPLLPGAAAQREGARRDAGRLRPAQLPRAGARPSPTPGGAQRRAWPSGAGGTWTGRSGASRRPRPSCWPRTGRRCCRCRPRPFEAAAGRAAAAADSLSLVRFDANDYSVPTRVRPPAGHGRRRRWTRSGSSSRTALVARHRAVLGPRAGHLRPGPLPGAAGAQAGRRSTSPGRWSGWELPVCFGVLRRRLEAELGGPGTRQFIRVLRLLETRSLARADASGRAGPGDRASTDADAVAADPGAPARSGRSGCSASTAGRTWPASASRRPTCRPTRALHGGGGAMKKTETKSTVLLKHHLKALKLPTMPAECEKVGPAVRRRERRPPGVPAPAVRAGADRAGAAGGRAAAEGGPVPGAQDARRRSTSPPAPSVNKPLVLELTRCDYLDRRENVLLVGAERHGQDAPGHGAGDGGVRPGQAGAVLAGDRAGHAAAGGRRGAARCSGCGRSWPSWTCWSSTSWGTCRRARPGRSCCST